MPIAEQQGASVGAQVLRSVPTRPLGQSLRA
ncbi:hypothetical protein ACVW07_002140 [Cellulomonas sp. URHB0016]